VSPNGESPKIPYTNPLPGKEVFKQPKPPKNVFYGENHQIIDGSPDTYYHEWSEKQNAIYSELKERQALKERQEAQTAKPPDEVKP
ncbi:MAG: hypothetical protein FWC50_11175, partial [Planctomycetaceae bacterium]|nr:hypothetical protein [Planctomycetaceae bacterium]